MAKMVATGKYFWAAFILAAVTLVQGPISNSVLERFSNGATGDWSTVSTRWVIWDIGVRLFAEHPLLGLGYGGWGPAFQQASGNVLGRSFPPHNFVLQAWADGGALSALLVLAFVAAVVRSLWRRVRFAEPQDVTDWALVAAGFAWLWLHGLGDATAFFGDIRTVTLVGVLLGLTWMGLPAREHPREDTAVAVGSTTAAAPPTSVVEKAPIQVVQDVRLPVKIKPV
jgi:O-antigen ligase